MLKRFALFFLALVLAVSPALADKNYTIEASAAHTATGFSSTIDVTGTRTLSVQAYNTATSGTTPQLDLFLQQSCDGGSNFVDLPYDVNLVGTGAVAGAGTVTLNNRDIIDALTTGTRITASLYSNYCSLVRVQWVISGTTPSFTFSVTAVGK